MCGSLLSPWFDKNSMDITGSWSGFRWWYPGVWLEDTWVEFGVCCFNNREQTFKVIVFHLLEYCYIITRKITFVHLKHSEGSDEFAHLTRIQKVLP